jgi:2-oxoisovalerate dehydrogenase E1 component
MKSHIPVKYSVKQTDKNTLLKWYRLLIVGRTLDERAPNYLKQAIGWSYHAPCAGHDGIQLAIGQNFRKEKDHLFPYYRDLQTCISAGMTAEEVIFNGISKDKDVAGGGRHMSNHLAKPKWNIHNVSSATGNQTLHAAGVGRGLKLYDNKDAVVISSQGESSTSEGFVYEAINGASREQMPVVFVFQDNGYGISVPKEDQTANRRAARNFMGIKNLRIIYCNGKDVFDSMNAMEEAVNWAKKEQKPVIVHANCVRIYSHSNSDRHELYRDKNELSYVKEYDPLAKYRRMLLRYEVAKEEELKDIENDVTKEVKDAHKKALKAADPKAESIHDFVLPPSYKAEKYPEGTHNEEGNSIKIIQALNDTLKAEFRQNPDTFLWGQDIANKEKGGVFNVSKGMQQEFGKKRIFNSPIAEDYIMGTANGMSRLDKKIRIVVEGAEFADYFWPAMEQYVETTHEYWRTKGQFSPNITIRLASGGYIGGGLYHSQTTEGALATFPGVRVVYPSFADDAAGLLRTSIRSEGMTLFLEPKALYNSPKASTVVPDDFEVPFGKARIRRQGKDMTMITYGNTTHMCIEAAEKMSEEDGIEVEVIDIRSLIPLDKESIFKSLEKTSRALIVHEDKVFGGFGGELAAIVAEEAFKLLDAPVRRVGSEFTPVGFNRILEAATLPNTDKVLKAARDLAAF